MKTKILLVYGSGGHNEQMKRLSEELLNEFRKDNKGISLISLCDEDVKHPMTEEMYVVSTVTDKFSYIKVLLKIPLRTIQTFLVLSKLMKQHNIKYMITTGPGIGILSGVYFKLAGKKVIHIETWSRFYSKSLTGRAMYYLADTFFVQNKELLDLYPKAIYKGRL